MKNKTKGAIAGIAGIALLAGGSTFALWSAEDKAAGGTITNGDLNVAAVGADAWFDVSADRLDATAAATPVTALKGHAITAIGTWRMVPGDTVEATRALDVTLQGDNLVAQLDVAVPVAAGAANVAATYKVYGLVGGAKTLLTPTAVAVGAPTQLNLAAPRTGQAAGSPTNTGRTVLDDAGIAPNVWVVVNAAFANVNGRVDATSTTTFQDLSVKVTQVRAGADFGA